MDTHPRDFVGYGANPPDPKWPGGARLAVNFVVNYEEGSEYSIAEGDGFTEANLTESPASPVPRGERDLGAESMFEYGSRVGFWRLMRLFAERDLPLTVFGCAMALERNPEAAQAIAAAGHDVCCHGWRWVEHFRLDEAEEAEHIRRAVASLEASVGARPLGWYCRYGPSVNTRRLLMKEGGFIYDSDAYNDELPYWVMTGQGPHLVVPYTLTNNDTKFARGFIGHGLDFFRYLRDAFDLLYEEGARQPKMMSIGLHMRIAGHPARASGLQRFLDHIRAVDDVWVCRREEIARHGIATHPYQSA
ncbi:MAG: allantoinase PuuE [Alphaproteobacteria bacterium]|jgi:putative urate catabolism protein|nr:allantoinase PuuE [Alphaproteobacteria bacterium]